jgi:hypothetical protein
MVVNCCCQCSYECALDTEANLDPSIEAADDAFHKDWIRLDTEKAVDFSSYVSVDSELVSCNISAIDDSCDDCEGDGSSEEEEEEGEHEPEPLPKFTPAHCVQNY